MPSHSDLPVVMKPKHFMREHGGASLCIVFRIKLVKIHMWYTSFYLPG